MTYLLGIDVGTTGCKVVLADEHGSVSATATRTYPLHTPHAVWAEQNSEDWWRAICEIVGDVLDAASVSPADVASIGLGKMHGLVLLEGCRRCAPCRDPLERPALGRAVRRDRAYGRAGARARSHRQPRAARPHRAEAALGPRPEPATYARVAHVLLPKDHSRYRLTGVLGTDVSDASGTSVFDVRNRPMVGRDA